MAFWHGLGLGLMLQLSVGPVFFALVQRAMTRGWREGIKMAAGVTATLVFLSLAAIGANRLSRDLGATASKALNRLVGCALLFFAFLLLWRAW